MGYDEVIMKTPIIDVHTHAFPDYIAPKVMEALRARYGVDSIYPCTISSLLDTMEKTQVDIGVVQIYANSPEKVRLLNDWGAEVTKRERPKIYCFGTIHPDMDDPSEELERIVKIGLKGVKFQPTAQRFYPDEQRIIVVSYSSNSSHHRNNC